MDMERRDIRSKECMFAVHRGMVDGIHISAVGIYHRGSVYDSIDVLGRVELSTGMITQPHYDLHKGIAIYGLYSGHDSIYVGYIDGVGAAIIEDPNAFLQNLEYLEVPALYGRKKVKDITSGDLWGANEDHWEFIPTQDGMMVFLNGSHQGRYTWEDIQTLIYRKYNVFEML
jgi:hypothetical protein